MQNACNSGFDESLVYCSLEVQKFHNESQDKQEAQRTSEMNLLHHLTVNEAHPLKNLICLCTYGLYK